jgi:GNAT superfamily N-acetyltransferase
MLLITSILANHRYAEEVSAQECSLKTAARVGAHSFLDDPMTIAQVQGIANPERMLEAHALIQAEHAARYGSFHLLDGGDPRAFMVAYDSLDKPWLSEIVMLGRTILATFQQLRFKEFRILTRNIRKHGKALNLSWYKSVVKGRHYRMKVIAIDPMLRGTGAFRRLITPALDYADRERIPAVLETHNPKNVGLYEHFGFELVRTITSPETHISQYCMIRKPQRRNNK